MQVIELNWAADAIAKDLDCQVQTDSLMYYDFGIFQRLIQAILLYWSMEKILIIRWI